MSLRGFGAEASVQRPVRTYRGSPNTSAGAGGWLSGHVVPQSCDFWTRLGCSIWPIPFCGPAGLGGAAAFVDCVDRLSHGGCVDCVLQGGVDPRRPTNPIPPPETDPQLNPRSSGLTIDLGLLQNQLNRIERCTCGSPWSRAWRYWGPIDGLSGAGSVIS
jgi:hypothetical protein